MSDTPLDNSETLLVGPDWLEQHRHDPDLRIIDARKGDGYLTSHIVGAVALGVSPLLHDNGDVLEPQLFARLMSSLGVGSQTMVIAYDDGNNLFAARLWWVLNYYGHTRVKVLNGGWDRWIAEGRPLESSHNTPQPEPFETRPNPDWIADTDYVRASIDSPQHLLLDVRGDAEWTRTESSGTTPSGHIPGAVHLVWSDVIDADSRHFRAANTLREMFGKVGVTSAKEITVYCQGGIRAAHTVFALKLAGFDKVRNYEGSWSVWSRLSSS